MNNKRLRVLHVVPSYLPATRYGGPIASVHGLCKGLTNSDMDVHVYTTSVDGDGDSDVPLNSPVDMDGVKVWYFKSHYGRRLYYAPQMKQMLDRHIREFDILHLHSVFLWPTWMAARCAARAGVPYIISPRGMLVAELIRRKSRWIKSMWIKLIENKSIHQSSGVHVTSEIEKEELLRLKISFPVCYCLPNGVDIPYDLGSVEDGWIQQFRKPFVLYLGRINWKKGLDRLIRSWKNVEDVRLLIAGNDEENYQRQLEDLACNEGVRDRIHFIGAVNGTQKWVLYKQAELFVLPSYSENFGNVVLEAIGMGCPVIVTPEVGLAPMVSNYAVGRVVDGDPETLAKQINSLMSDKKLRSEMSRNGIKVVSNEYTWMSVAKKMKNIYSQIVFGS